jgi:hypothetical protein
MLRPEKGIAVNKSAQRFCNHKDESGDDKLDDDDWKDIKDPSERWKI